MLASLLGAAVLVEACASGSPPTPSVSPATPQASSAPQAPARTKARWAIPDRTFWVERTEAGIDRLLVGGVRVETKGVRVVATAALPNDLDGAESLPIHAQKGEAPHRYVLWHEREIFVAKDWLGEAKRIGELPAPVTEATDFLDGTLLHTHAGLFLVRAHGSAPERVDVPGGVKALAVDEARAIVLTVFGHALLTLDGGKSYRDISDQTPEPVDLEVRGDELHVLLTGGGARVLGKDGKMMPVDAPTGLPRHELPPDLEDRWPSGGFSAPIETATQFGILLRDGDALTNQGAKCARVDLETGRATALFVPDTTDERCEPFRAKDGPLLVCESEGHVRVLDVERGGRIERTFDRPPQSTLDRFVGVEDEALGFVGPCEGEMPPLPADVVTGASPTNASPERSPVFCVRKGPDAWIEHRLDPVDATDVVAWIPRADGGAVAIVAVPGTFIAKGTMPRISQKGGLRVVRLARNEPPLDISTYTWDSFTLLSRSLRSTADGGVVGWIGSAHGPSGIAAVTIDPEGRPTQHAIPPRATRVTTSGRFGLVSTEDNKLYQTLDYGRTFTPAELPPSTPGNIEPISCTEVGCRVGGFVRIGWDEGKSESVAEIPPPSPDMKRALPDAPLVRLQCHFTGQGETKRINESFGLGFTSSPVPRMSPGRIGFTGSILIPWNGPQISASSDAEIAYVRPFDLEAPIIRQTVPLSRLGPTPFHPYEVHLGYLLDGPSLSLLVSSGYGRCAAPLVDEAGLTIPTGGCVQDPTVGVVIGGHATLVHQAYGRQVISSMALPENRRDGPAKPGQKTLPHAPRELVSRRLPEHAAESKVGAGERDGAPVAVAIDASGQAVLVPINPKSGALGAEEPLAPLTELRAPTDPRCKKNADKNDKNDKDARVLLPFETAIGLVDGALPGVTATGTAGLAIVRWSRAHACLEAIEIAVRDERFEQDLGFYDPAGTVRKLIAKLEGKDAGKAALLVLANGSEVRQPVVCDGVMP